MKSIRIKNIIWDTNRTANLPKEYIFDNVPDDIIEEVKANGYCEEVQDRLCDEFGFLIKRFDVEVI